MTYKLKLNAEAVLDIREAFEWYEEQKDGLGYELLKEIENCYKRLIDNPYRYSHINELYRRAQTNRFHKF